MGPIKPMFMNILEYGGGEFLFG
ncbi:hypothetical protein V6N13_041156 [Hibiscus sabdariffa]